MGVQALRLLEQMILGAKKEQEGCLAGPYPNQSTPLDS